jgi:hypothetical protein
MKASILLGKDNSTGYETLLIRGKAEVEGLGK